MNVTQQGQQYNAAKPTSKALTIIDANADEAPYWTIKRFYHKGHTKVSGAKGDTRKVRVKVVDQHWPFNDGIKRLPWFYGKDCVVTHKELQYNVYSGFVDDVTEKTTGYLLELYVTEVSDRT